MTGDVGIGGPPAPGLEERLERAPCGYITFSDDGLIRLINSTLLGLLGYDREELVGRHIEGILTVGTRIFYQTHWFPLLRLHGHAEEVFLMFRTRAGEEIGALVNAVREGEGRGAEYSCVVMHVRERKKYEDELLHARRAADQARGEAETRARKLEAANELLEEQAAELEAQQEELEEQAAQLIQADDELRRTNQELVARTEEAEVHRKAAEEANRAKSTFLAVMSHELRTPLNAIAGYLQLLDMGIHGVLTEAQRGALDRIDRNQRHLLRLINDVLNLARIEAGRVEYAIEPIPVEEVVAAVRPMIEPQVARKGIQFSTDFERGAAVLADRDKLQQVLLNLLSNAVKFTPAEGSIRLEGLRSADGPDWIHFSVTDSGVGIPADKVATVFEPFVQVDPNPSRRQEGTGLGLAISRDLARGMNGDLSAESQLGKGSTFHLKLPAAD